MAAELKELDPKQKVTLIHSRDRLLSAEPLPDDFKERVCSVLQNAGVQIILSQRVVDHKAAETTSGKHTWHLTLANGTEIKAGHVMSAVSKCLPTSSYLPEQTLDHEGYVKIHPTYATSCLLSSFSPWLTDVAVNYKTTSPTQPTTLPSGTSLPGLGSSGAVAP